MQNPQRYLSIDVLRGWTVAAMLLVNSAGDWDHVFPWLDHAHWNGCTPADFVFPFFLFIVGLSLELALAPQLAKGVDATTLRKQAIQRGARMILLGVGLHIFAWMTIEGRAFRLMGVLQRIGIVFAIAACLMLYLRSQKSRWIALAGVMALHTLLLLTGGSLQPNLNLSDRIDSLVLGSLAYQFDAVTQLAREPEGLLSSLGALASALLGVQAATLLRSGSLRGLSILGAACLLAGVCASFALPWNKQLWTASFVLWTSGWAILVLLAVHALVDVARLPAVGRSFGINALAAYAGSWIATCLLAFTGVADWTYRSFFVPYLVPLIGNEWSSAAFAAVFTAVFAMLTYWMARRNYRIVI